MPEDPGTADPSGEPPSKMAEGPHGWPRRRVLRWALSGLIPVAAGGWVAARWLRERKRIEREEEEWAWRAQEEEFGEGTADEEGPEEPREENTAWATNLTQEAALYCQAGHEGASSRLGLALQAAPSHAPARLMRACWFLQTKRWDLARQDLAFPSIRDTPEARLLSELADRLPRAPDWSHAFHEAWQALGRPDFRKSLLLPTPLQPNHMFADTVLPWHTANEERRFLLVVLNPALAETYREPMLEQVRTHSSVPLLMALRERLQDLEAQTPSRQFLLPAVEARLGQLGAASSQTLQLGLLAFLSGNPPTSPFERRDLEALERLVALPEWKQPSSEQFFEEMRGRFGTWLLAPLHHAWLLASAAQAPSLGVALLQRAKASRERLTEDERHWMGRLLWEVGARLRGQRSRVELDLGLRLQIFGAELTGHGLSREESLAAWMELGRWEEALEQAAYYRWPLAPLQEESCALRAHSEQDWMKAFVARGQMP